MIQRLEIDSVHYHASDDLKRYVRRKIGKLDRYLNRHSRRSVHAQIKLKEHAKKDKKQCTCEVVLFLPNETLTVHESTMNMFAAVDIVETKLKNQLKKYKEKHHPSRRRALARRLSRSLRFGERQS